MNLNQLEILQYLQETGYNVTKAAEKMHVVQSAVSRQLLMLEDELGSPLFKRHGKRLLGPTRLGLDIMEQVAAIRQAKRNIKVLADDFLENRNGALHIATTHTQAKYLLPEPIGRFKQQYPAVKIYIEQSSPDNLIQLLYEQKVDLAICTEKLDKNEKLVIKPCYHWHHVVIVPHGHPLADGEFSLRRLTEFPILTYCRGFTGRSNLEKAFAAAGMELEITLAAADSDVIKTYVRLGLGVGIIAGTSLGSPIDNDLAVRDLSQWIPQSTTKFAYLKDSYLPSYANYFIKQLLDATRHKPFADKIARAE